MRLLTGVCLAVLVAATQSGCTTGADANRATTKKVSDQKLSVYRTVRRLTYRGACGNDQELSVCVERILSSAEGTVVEGRITGLSASPGGNPKAAKWGVLLQTSAGETLQATAESLPSQDGEATMTCRLQGEIHAEPTFFQVSRHAEAKSAGAGSLPIRVDLL